MTVVLSSLCSGLIAVVVTLLYERKAEEKRIKKDLIIELFSYKYLLTPKHIAQPKDKLIIALNKIPIVFSNNKEVLTAYDEFYNAIVNRTDITNTSNGDECLRTLLKKAATAAGIHCDEWDDVRFSNALN